MFKKLFYLTLFLITLSIVAILTVLYLSVEDKAMVASDQRMAEIDIEKIKRIIQSNKPAAVMSGKKIKLRLTSAEANQILALASKEYLPKINAVSEFPDNRLKLKLSYRLPDNPAGRFLNISVMLKLYYGKYFTIEALKIGKVVVPEMLLPYMQPLIKDFVKKYYGGYFVLWKHIKRIDIYNSVLTINYKITRNNFERVRRLARQILVSDKMRERIKIYSKEMTRLSDELGTDAQSIMNFMRPVFKLAERRSLAGNSAIEENRVAILTLAAFNIGKNPLSYVSDIEIKKPERIILTLKGREDLAKHYLLSAAITALLDTKWSSAIGLNKELQDADGGSGFSFVDLMADMAGNKLAAVMQSERRAGIVQARIVKMMSEDDIMGNIEQLQEGLSAAEFRVEYGNSGSEEYVTVVREINRRLRDCVVYH